MAFRACGNCVTVFGKQKLSKDLSGCPSAKPGGKKRDVFCRSLFGYFRTGISAVCNDRRTFAGSLCVVNDFPQEINITPGIDIVLIVCDEGAVCTCRLRDIRRISAMFFSGFDPVCRVRVGRILKR